VLTPTTASWRRARRRLVHQSRDCALQTFNVQWSKAPTFSDNTATDSRDPP